VSDTPQTESYHSATGIRRWLLAIGPGLVTACVVIGPGSILTSSKVGATHGYSMAWIVVISVFVMMIYMTLGAKLGVVTRQSSGDLVTRKVGRWLAVLIGFGAFFISALYQFGNNVGVHSAIQAYADWDYWVVLFNAAAIAFLFVFKDLYKALERAMSIFVGIMLVAFAVNLWFARPDLGEMIKGFVPSTTSSSGKNIIDLNLLGLIGTTFVITAAYYQSYLARYKGWNVDELKEGLVDTRVGSLLMMLITLMIMFNASATFFGTVDVAELKNVNDVAAQLESAFGPKGRALFCVGLFSAAYSSFLVNSMIGGFILADGLGLGSKPTDLWPRLLTVGVLLTGMLVGLFIIVNGWDPVPAIVAAQAVTVLVAPLMAGTLWWLTSREDVMGKHKNGLFLNIAAGIGFALLLLMAYRLVTVEIPDRIDQLRTPAAAVEAADEPEQTSVDTAED
jgi:manganese transport protein